MCSVGWSKKSPYLAYGDNKGVLRIVDINKKSMIIELECHDARIGSLAWNDNLIATGS